MPNCSPSHVDRERVDRAPGGALSPACGVARVRSTVRRGASAPHARRRSRRADAGQLSPPPLRARVDQIAASGRHLAWQFDAHGPCNQVVTRSLCLQRSQEDPQKVPACIAVRLLGSAACGWDRARVSRRAGVGVATGGRSSGIRAFGLFVRPRRGIEAFRVDTGGHVRARTVFRACTGHRRARRFQSQCAVSARLLPDESWALPNWRAAAVGREMRIRARRRTPASAGRGRR